MAGAARYVCPTRLRKSPMPFDGCTTLTSVTVSDKVTDIGAYAFYDCASLTAATLGDKVESIGYSAFSGCSLLTQIRLPASLRTVANNAFGGCSALAMVSYPGAEKKFGEIVIGTGNDALTGAVISYKTS